MCASDRLGRLLLAMLRGICVVALGLFLAAAFAQQPSREQEQLRRLRQQVQQLQQSQTTQQEAVQRAEADKAAARAQLATAQSQLGALQAAARRARADAATQAQALEAANKELATLRTEQAALLAQRDGLQAEARTSAQTQVQLRSAGAELQRQLTQAEAVFADLTGRHHLQAVGLQTCIDNNRALRDVGQDLMQRYAAKTVADVMADNEPFLGLRRVAMENLLQGYQDKLDQFALKAPARAASPQGDGSTAPGSARGR